MKTSDKHVDNQHEEIKARFAPEVEHVKGQLLSGVPVSEIALELQTNKIGFLIFIHIFREATGAGIGELKGFGRWLRGGSWDLESGEFDAYASELSLHERAKDHVGA